MPNLCRLTGLLSLSALGVIDETPPPRRPDTPPPPSHYSTLPHIHRNTVTPSSNNAVGTSTSMHKLPSYQEIDPNPPPCFAHSMAMAGPNNHMHSSLTQCTCSPGVQRQTSHNCVNLYASQNVNGITNYRTVNALNSLNNSNQRPCVCSSCSEYAASQAVVDQEHQLCASTGGQTLSSVYAGGQVYSIHSRPTPVQQHRVCSTQAQHAAHQAAESRVFYAVNLPQRLHGSVVSLAPPTDETEAPPAYDVALMDDLML